MGVASALSAVPRQAVSLVLRLTKRCHDGSFRDQVDSALTKLGRDSLDGVLVPWTGQKRFVETWRNLKEDVRIKWLGTDHLEIAELERLDELPSVNLTTLSPTNRKARLTHWCHARAIEVLAMLPPLEAQERAAFQDLKSDVDPHFLLTRWAVQHGLVALPDFTDWLYRPVPDADAYAAWTSAFATALRCHTKHLDSPAEQRRLHLSPDALLTLAHLDPATPEALLPMPMHATTTAAVATDAAAVIPTAPPGAPAAEVEKKSSEGASG